MWAENLAKVRKVLQKRNNLPKDYHPHAYLWKAPSAPIMTASFIIKKSLSINAKAFDFFKNRLKL